MFTEPSRGTRFLLTAALLSCAPAAAGADELREIVSAAEQCLGDAADPSDPGAEALLLTCLAAAEEACRPGQPQTFPTRQACWDLEAGAWSLVRDGLLDDLRLALSSAPRETATALESAHAAWLRSRYDDCALESNRWAGSQRLIEQFTCPIRAEARRAITYLVWLEETRRIYGPAEPTDLTRP